MSPNAVKIVVRARGHKLCARIMWLRLARYKRLRLGQLASGKIRLA
ncbi:MAG TPA: hypothetical protein VIH42_02070 [Thermoguttaceae bacterium]